MFGSKSRRSLQRRGLSFATAAGLTLLVSPVVALVGESPAHAATDPVGVSFTLEGCKNAGNISLPNADGNFICPDADYTTGNLDKGWSELDLVPHRITSSAGNSAPNSQTFAVVIAADNLDTGSAGQEPGYDVISAPVLNTSLSTNSGSDCALTAGASQIEAPGQGGIDATIYRALSITQPKNTTCVFDYYERLALGSHLFPGSALHSNLLNQALGTAGIGSKEVSIPVKEIAPQELKKDMSATQGATYTWTLGKQADPTVLTWNNTCGSTSAAPQSKSVTVTVDWTRSAQTPSGSVTLTTHVTATNPASRTVTVNVNDKMYTGSTQTNNIDDENQGPYDLAAGASHTFTFTKTYTGSATSFNDVATGTYTDKVTGVAIPQTTTATASADLTTDANAVTNASAVITDTQSISGTGFSYSIDSVTPSGNSPTTGNGFTSYTAGTKTTSDVAWTSATIAPSGTGAASGSFAFAETVYVTTPGNYTGTLSDTAHIKNGSTDLYDPQNASTSLTASAANPTVTIHKSVDIAPTSDAVFTFSITNRDTNAVVSNVSVTIPAGSLSAESAPVTVAPSSTGYVVHETSQPAEYSASGDVTDSRALGLCGSETVNVSDSRNMGTITVDKTRVGDPIGAATTFSFTVDCPGTTYDQTLAIDLTSKTSDSKTTGQIPTGTVCTVTEGDHTGWTVTPTASQSATVGDTVSFTNTRDTGIITVNKSMVGDPTGASRVFAFHVDCPGTTYDQDLSIDLGNATSGSQSTGQIPTGLTCTVSEGASAGWTTTVDPTSGQTTVPGSVTFTNTRDTGRITVNKSLVGDATGAATSFAFRVDCPGTAYDQDLSLTLSGTSGSVSTGLIPTGLVCTVTEGPSPGWTVSVVPSNGAVTVPGDVAFTNTRDTGVITVTKTTVGAAAGASTVFVFNIVCPANSAYNQSVTLDTATASSATSGQIPTGLACTVTEASTAGWQQTTPAQGGVDVTVPGTATFENTRLTGPLQLAKSVAPSTGSYVPGDPNNTLTYTLSLSPTGALDHTNVVVTDYIPGFDPADTASGKTTYVDGSATCSTGCAATYDATNHLLTWAVGDVNHDAAPVILTFKVTIDQPTFDATVGLPAETIDNVGYVQSLQQDRTPSNEVKTPVTAVLGVKVVRKPVQKPAVLPFTGFGLPLGPTIWTALTLLGTGAILTSVRRRRKA